MTEKPLSPAEMEEILKSYTTIFIIFDIVFFSMIFIFIILLIHYIKSRKNIRDSNEYLMYTIKGQEEERERIARELHDTVAQNIRWCKSLCEKSDAKDKLSQIEEYLSKSLSQVRSISYNLAPPDITKNDFLLCIKNLCEEFTENSSAGIRLSILENTTASFLNRDEILNLYRIVQEALSNISKHAQADEIVILIRNQAGSEEKGLYIFISDDGKGFDVEKVDAKKHFGLKGMKKRADLIGAELSVVSKKDYGTQVKIFKSESRKSNILGGGIRMNSKNNGFFVVEDHTVTNIGLTSLIGQKTGLACLGSAFSKSEALKKIRALAESGSENLPGIIILDLFLGEESGIDVLRFVRSEYPSIKILVYSMYAKPGILSLVLEEGAHGFVEKSAPESILITAVKKIISGETFIQQNLVSSLFTYKTMYDGLTRQEQNVFKKILERKGKVQIAEELGISPRSVDNYFTRIFEKTACKNIHEVISKYGE